MKHRARYWRADGGAVRTRDAGPLLRAWLVAVAGGQGAGDPRCSRHDRDQLLPAAERSHRPPGGACVRPGAGDAAAPAAGQAAPDAFSRPRPARRPLLVSRTPTLPVPVTGEGRAGLAALLADPGQALVALDFDGTLSPIVADPAAARAHPGAVPALRQVAAVIGTLAVIDRKSTRLN